jgi:hypothetical protein
LLKKNRKNLIWTVDQTVNVHGVLRDGHIVKE